MRNNKMDFTLKIYKKFLHSLLINDYSFQKLKNFIQHSNKEKIVILRHDVDRLPENALVIAKIEKDAGIRASYYFRIVKESYDEDIIRQIAEMRHEIGYHYENLSDPQITPVRFSEPTPVPSAGATPVKCATLSLREFHRVKRSEIKTNLGI